MSLTIKENLTKTNLNVNSSRAIKYIVIHYTANNGDTAWGNTNYFKTEYRGASAHYFVDEIDIWRSVLDKDTAWHCGTSGTYVHAICRNSNSIGIELCSRKTSAGVYYIKDETIATGIALTKELMLKYNIPAENVIRHYDVTGKICPEPMVRTSAEWTRFKDALKGSVTAPVQRPSGIEYSVKVIADDLNVRSGAGTNYSVVSVIKDKGTYTIIDEANGTGAKLWGKLKSGLGWISLDFTEKQSAQVILPAKSNEEIIWSFLRTSGLNDCGTAGLMGNLFAESGLVPTNLQNTFNTKFNLTDLQYTDGVDKGTYTNFVHDRGGYGLAQWTYWSRKENLLNYAKSSKRSIGDLMMQLEFLWKELQGYPKVIATLKSAKTVLEASNAVLLDYERPANQGTDVQKKRSEYGTVYYDKYAEKVLVIQTSWAPKDSDIQLAVKFGIVASPEYWGGITTVQYLDALFSKVVSSAKVNAQTNNNVVDLTSALNILTNAGIVSSPDYWKQEATKTDAVKWLDSLIINMAKRVA